MSVAARRHGEGRSIEIVERVAEKTNTSPADLPPLYEAIDPDALDAVFDSAAGQLTVTFTYCDYRIELAGSEQLTVSDTAE